MTTQTALPAPTAAFNVAEAQALHALRARYQQDRDLFSERERAHLHFLRWLYQTGRVVP